MYAFKIRDRNTGLYLKKGADTWSKIGKVWPSFGYLKLALNLKKRIPPNWEIVVFSEHGNINADLAINSKLSEDQLIDFINDKE